MGSFSERRGYNKDADGEYLGNRLVMEWALDDGERNKEHQSEVIDTNPDQMQWMLDKQPLQEESSPATDSGIIQNREGVRAFVFLHVDTVSV